MCCILHWARFFLTLNCLKQSIPTHIRSLPLSLHVPWKHRAPRWLCGRARHCCPTTMPSSGVWVWVLEERGAMCGFVWALRQLQSLTFTLASPHTPTHPNHRIKHPSCKTKTVPVTLQPFRASVRMARWASRRLLGGSVSASMRFTT